MFELVFLGTSASRPTAERGLPALMVLHESERFLIDCGEGTQRQLIRAALGYRRLRHVFLTHDHLDHVLGLGGLIASLSEMPEPTRLTIHAGREALALAERLARNVVLPETDQGATLEFVPLHAGQAIRAEGLSITPIPVVHRAGESFGFLFEEPARRHLDSGRAANLGVPAGPLRQSLSEGTAVTLEDGRRIVPDDVLGPSQTGTRLLVIGDAAETASLVAPARGVDGLVIEATFLTRDAIEARRHGHLTAREAASLARDAGVGCLVITHISARYEGHELLAEARELFPATELARDLSHVRIARGSRD
ncbi:MAG: MBL fold metallo-hydrolase [Alphaproteobacteria bacterium]|nr:MBL fold metallo-hydrolase [Alphaproteobacteria bacterium]